MKYASICFALISRYLKVFRAKLVDTLINSAILVSSQVLIFGYLFPLIGMPTSFIGPAYIGSIVFFLIHFGFVFGLTLQFDLEGDRLIDYQLTLPMPKKWLFLSYIISFVIETTVVIVPMLGAGILLLGNRFGELAVSPLLLILSFLAMITFTGTFFLGLAFYYSYAWFSLNIWPRRLSVIMAISATFYLWKELYRLKPTLSYIVLLSPFTHIAESLRASLLDPTRFLPYYVTLPTLLFFIIVSSACIAFASKKRLDPV